MKMEAEEYRYGWLQRTFTVLFTLLWTSVSVFTVSMVIFSLVRWVAGNAPVYIELRDIIGGSIALTIMALAVGFMAAIFANLKPNVRVSDKGLAIQNLLLWWHLIPWEEVKDIRSVPLFGSRVRLVVVRKLPLALVYRLIGTMYFAFFQPAFLISSGIDNYDGLVHTIKKKIGKELWE
jgi:hypothetical protein